MFKNKRVRLASVLMLILCLLAPLFSGVYGNRSVKSAGMNSNDLRREYIKMAKKKSLTDLDIDNMSVGTLRMLALYISNFYVPWSTTLDGEDKNKVNDKIVKALVNTCGFNKETAEVLIKKVSQYSLGTAKQLYFHTDSEVNVEESFGALVNIEDGEDDRNDSIAKSFATIAHDSVDGSKTYDSCYYRATVGTFFGGFDRTRQKLASNEAGGDKPKVSEEFSFYWADDSSYTSEDAKQRVVLKSNGICNLAYAEYMDKADCSKGIGWSLFTADKDTMGKVSGNDLRKTLFLTSQLYVDWVGNIIVDDGFQRYIFLPACSNPYSLSLVGNEEIGKRLPMQNLISNYRYGQGLITASEDTVDLDDKTVSMYLYSSGESIYEFGGPTDEDGNKTRLFRGSSDTNIGDNCSETLKEALQTKDKAGNYMLRDDFWDESAVFDSWKIDSFLLNKEKSALKGMNNYYLAINTDNGSNISAIDNSVWVDTLGEDSADNLDVFNVYHVTDSKHKMGSGTKFACSEKLGEISQVESADSSVLLNIYLTYLFAFCNYTDGVTDASSVSVINLTFNGDRFPAGDNMDELIDWSDIELSNDALQKEVLSMAYLIMHPTKGIEFVATMLKNKISGFLISWHEDIVGETDSNAALGVAGYIGFTGYTTIPNLHDLEWTDWLLQNYNSIIVYLILIIAVIMCCYIIVGQMTVQKAIIGVFIFAVLSFLPPLALNMSADLVNTTGDMIYGEKFVYWALVQHQSYLQDLYSAKSSENSDAYRDFVLDVQSSGKGGTTSGKSFDTVKLKWMSPKKDNYMATLGETLQEETKSSKDSNEYIEMARGLLSKNTSGEDFLDSNKALYLYRDYMNVTMYALKSYNIYSTYTCGDKVKKDKDDYKLQVSSWWSGDNKNKDLTFQSGKRYQNAVMANYEVKSMVQHIQGYRDTSSLTAVRNGWLYNTLGDTNLNEKADYYSDNTMATNYLLNYTEAYKTLYQSNEKLKKLGSTKGSDKEDGYNDKTFRSYGIPQNKFNFTLSDLSEDESDKYSKSSLDYFYYGLYTESPFYFFSYNLLDQMKTSTDYTFSLEKEEQNYGSGDFKDLILQEGMGYFFNITDNAGDGYGELRDFMNMHDLFWYVLPLMRQGNQNVRQFDDLHGMELFDDVRVRFTMNGDVMIDQDGKTYLIDDIKGVDNQTIDISEANKNNDKYTLAHWADISKDWDKEKKYKFWHNYNVAVMFNEYSPWADTLYDCNYARGEWISVAGEKYYVENPLDPSSYFSLTKEGEIDEGRPMIFSRSELKYYGLEETQLTEVERKILRVQDAIYEKSMDLMNYFNFDDDVLVSAMAMFEVFEFNKEFSQKTVVGEDFILYPQAYELKAFSYDAYLRLILSNTTGENLQTEENKSLYTRIIENTSIFFGILLVILDILCVYVIPAFKLFFLVMLFFMSVVMIVASAVNIELNIFSAVFKSLIKPLCMFIGVCLGLSWSVSLFMYAGNKEVTGDLSPTIRLGDPSMVCIVMLVINIVAVILYWRICKATFKDFMKYVKAVWENIAGNVAGALKMVAGGMLAHKALNAIRGIGHGGSGGGAGGSGGGAGGNSNEPKRRAEENDPEKPKMDGNTGGVNDKSDGNNSGDNLATGAAVAGAGVVAHNTGKMGKEEVEAKKKEIYDRRMREGKEGLNKPKDEKSTAEKKLDEHRGMAQSARERQNAAKDMRKSMKGQKGTLGKRAFLYKEEVKERSKAVINNVKGVSDKFDIAKNNAKTRIQNTNQKIKNVATAPSRVVRRRVDSAKKSYQRNTQMAQASIKRQMQNNRKK